MKIALSVPKTIGLTSALEMIRGYGVHAIEIAIDQAIVMTEAPGLEIAGIVCGSDLAALPNYIDPARKLACTFLIIPSGPLFNRSGIAPPAIAERLLNSADIAAAAGVMLLLENEPTHGSALRLWRLLDRLNHPSIACCWNTPYAVRAGDHPAVAVPLLNSRIAYLHLQDAKCSGSLSTPRGLAEGDLQLRETMNRLRGIGFDGVISVDIPKSITPDHSEPEGTIKWITGLVT